MLKVDPSDIDSFVTTTVSHLQFTGNAAVANAVRSMLASGQQMPLFNYDYRTVRVLAMHVVPREEKPRPG